MAEISPSIAALEQGKRFHDSLVEGLKAAPKPFLKQHRRALQDLKKQAEQGRKWLELMKELEHE